MPQLVLLNKPFNVLSQFTDKDARNTLADYISTKKYPGFYPAGRLDYDSEGLIVLTNDGNLQNRIASPKNKLEKSYWVQVEGNADDNAISELRKGVGLKDGMTRPAKVKVISEPSLWRRDPPIRHRKNVATSWLELSIREGKNRQIRRMTAAVGFPTLRLVRFAVGDWRLSDLLPGEFREVSIYLPPPHSKKYRRRSEDASKRRSLLSKPKRHP